MIIVITVTFASSSSQSLLSIKHTENDGDEAERARHNMTEGACSFVTMSSFWLFWGDVPVLHKGSKKSYSMVLPKCGGAMARHTELRCYQASWQTVSCSA